MKTMLVMKKKSFSLHEESQLNFSWTSTSTSVESKWIVGNHHRTVFVFLVWFVFFRNVSRSLCICRNLGTGYKIWGQLISELHTVSLF